MRGLTFTRLVFKRNIASKSSSRKKVKEIIAVF